MLSRTQILVSAVSARIRLSPSPVPTRFFITARNGITIRESSRAPILTGNFPGRRRQAHDAFVGDVSGEEKERHDDELKGDPF